MIDDQPNKRPRNAPLDDLLAIGSQLRPDSTPASLLREVAEAIRHVTNSPLVYIRMRNHDDALAAGASAGLSAELWERLRQTTVAPSFYHELFQPARRISESFVIPANSATTIDPALIDGEFGDLSTLLVPIRGRGERLLGVISVATAETLDQTEVIVIETMARQAALAIENVILAERSARLLAKEQLLVELGRDVSATLDLQTILLRTVARLEAAFGGGSLALLNAEQQLEVVAVAAADKVWLGQQAPPGEGMAGWAVRQGQALFINDLQREPRFDRLLADPPELSNYRAWIIAPLRSGGQIIGTLNVGAAEAHSFSFEDVDLLEAIAAQIGGPIAGARLYQESQRLAAQVQQRADQLTVLNTIARTAAATLDQEQMLPEIATQIHAGFGYAQVDLFLLDEESNELVLAAANGFYGNRIIGYRQHINLGVLGRALRTSQSQIITNVNEDPDYLRTTARPDTRSEICVPIEAGGRMLGLLNAESPEIAAFRDEDRAMLETIADILAGSLENLRLYRRAQTAAVLEERNRLARELHDSVSQQLFSMTLTAQAARAQLTRNPDRAAVQLERLQETATAALAEMRALILQLRPPALRDQGLVAALQQHAAILARREGLRIELSVTGDERMARGVEQPLFRIVQEALNNVIKHAHASNVSIGLEFASERLRVRISDDGRGFDATSTTALGVRHLGLIGMRERAAEIGGMMELQSIPGEGTEVLVTIPRQHGAHN